MRASTRRGRRAKPRPARSLMPVRSVLPWNASTSTNPSLTSSCKSSWLARRPSTRSRRRRSSTMPLRPGYEPVENVRKIAVLRAGGLGDSVFTLPALRALRETYPGAEITLLGGPIQTELLSERPGPPDRAIMVPPSTGVNGPDTGVDEDEEELERFFANMRKERFDLALQMHGGGGYSNPFVRRLGARITAGAQAPGAPPLDRSIPYVYYQSEYLRHLEVASLVGARAATLEPRLV